MESVKTYIKPYIGAATIAGLLKIAGTIADLSLPYFTSLIIDEGVANTDVEIITKFGLLMFIISVAGMVSTLLAHRKASRVSQDFARDIRNGMFTHIQTYSLKELETISTASLITRITNDVHQVQQLLLMTMRMFVRTPVLAIGGSVMAFVLDPQLALILLALLPFLYLVMMYTLRKTRPIYKRLQINLDRLTVVLRENLTGVKVIKAFGRSDYERGRFQQRSKDVMDGELSAGRILAFVNPLIALLMNVAVIAVVFFGGVRVNVGGMQTGEILAFLNYITMILNSFMNISKIFSMCTRSAASTARINEVFATQATITDPEQPKEGHGDKPAITFDHVTFRYPGDKHDSLEDVSFFIGKGETLAIIGPTGCGKSTIVNLLMRFYDPDEGAIYVDGVNIRDIPLDQLRMRISTVLQQAMLFSGTISDNIRWGRPEATQEDIEKAAGVAQIHDFILQMPQKYETHISQGAVNLSGGQKQRVSIARAIIKRSEILAMDDSSSALDFTTDLRLRQAIRRELGPCTVVLIAQRISTVMNADRILVLDKGMVSGFGNHHQLMAGCQIYQEIYTSQMGGVTVDGR